MKGDKEMKKLLVLFLIMTMILSVFTGCAPKQQAVNTNDEQAKVTEEPQKTNEEEKAETYFDGKIKVSEETVTFIDARGEEITINKNPKKVIGLYASYLDLWYEAGGEIVARLKSRSKIPEAFKDAEEVGTMTQPNAEKILEIQPDLVIFRHDMRGQGDLIPILEGNNIPFITVNYDNFEEYSYVMKIFTAITDRDDLYKEKVLKVKDQIDSILAKTPKDKEPSVLLMFATAKGVSVKLENSFVGDMLKELGAKNIAYDAKLTDEEMQVFSMEKVLERDPDFILVQTMGDIEKIKDRLVKDVENNPAWGALTAVKEGRYIILPKDLYLYKPNARYAQAYEGIAQILYPELFK